MADDGKGTEEIAAGKTRWKQVSLTKSVAGSKTAATADKSASSQENAPASAPSESEAQHMAAHDVAHHHHEPCKTSSERPAAAAAAAADKSAGGQAEADDMTAATADACKAAADAGRAAAAAANAGNAAEKTLTNKAKPAIGKAAVKDAAAVADGAAGTASAKQPGSNAAQKSSAAADPAGGDGREAKTPAAAVGDGSSTAAAAAAAARAPALNDPSFIPGTPEFEIAAKKVRETLEVYKARTKQHLEQKKAKPDMIAYKELRIEYTPAERHGHIPGVRVGQEFLGRGELAILGLHTSMMRGIMSKKGKPAYAVAMSGGYKDDTDTGETFWYTGQGGQKAGKQAEDQSYASPDNAALVESYKSQAPVRVFRGKVGADGERLYIYEGLYMVAAHKLEQSKDGPLVCKFQMVGIPGHSVVSGTVEYRCLHKAQFQSLLLARRPAARLGKKRGRTGEIKRVTRAEVELRVQERSTAGQHGRLITPDLAEGQETLPIPVWNAVDDEDSILLQLGNQTAEQPDPNSMEEEPAEFLYSRDYKFGEEEARQLAIAAEKAFHSSFPETCGILYAGREGDNAGNYNEDDLMLSTQPSGVMECDEGCQHSKVCRLNRVVSEGIRYPLEVFKVSKDVGWGVRCSQDLPVGAFICCYIGLVITDDWAEKLRHQDLYLFDLNHFHLLWDVDDAHTMADVTLNTNLHQLTGELRSKHLVIDASRQGNVGRFINHSCDPNCVIQTVFAGNARSQLLYYVAVIAAKDIPAYSEITYDYGYANKPAAAGEAAVGGSQAFSADAASGGQDASAVRIRCRCGSTVCRQSLL